MKYIWEAIRFLFGKNKYRDDFDTVYRSLHVLTALLQTQLNMQEIKINEQAKRLDHLEDIRHLAHKLEYELKKCKEAYEKCLENSE